MKQHLKTVLLLSAIVTSCLQEQKLTKKSAAEQIIKAYYTPQRSYDLRIYCADPSFAAKVKNAGLDKEGLVTIQETYTGSELGNNLVKFTSKAVPYQLKTSPELQQVGVQLVKVADFKFGGIKEIRDPGDRLPVEVDYIQVNENVNGFSRLANYDFSEVKTKTATFNYDTERGYLIALTGRK